MASIERTQIFTFNATGSGLTGNQYLQLGTGSPALGTVFCVRFLSLSSSSGFLNVAPSFTVYASDDAVGTNQYLICTDTLVAATANNEPYELFNNYNYPGRELPTSQALINQAYLVINANVIAAGTVTVIVSYLEIPSTNVLAPNFCKVTGTAGVGTTSIFTPSTTNVCFLKTLLVTNYADAVNSYVVQPVLLNAGTPVGYLDPQFTLAPYTTYILGIPLFLSTTSPAAGDSLGLIVTSSGTDTLNYYLSYDTDPNA